MCLRVYELTDQPSSILRCRGQCKIIKSLIVQAAYHDINRDIGIGSMTTDTTDLEKTINLDLL